MQVIEVTDLGVRSAVIRLRRRESSLWFVFYPMIHVARPTFYEDVTARLRSADTIVAEGVRRGPDRRGSVLALALTLSYRVLGWRRRLGLVEQDIDYSALGVPVVTPDVDTAEFLRSWRRIPLAQRLVVWCVLPVVVIGRLFGATAAIWSKAMEVNDLPSEEEENAAESSPELAAAFGGERDIRLVDALSRLHEERHSQGGEIAVVYGAAHVPFVVHALHDRHGYVARVGEWLTVVDFADGQRDTDHTPRVVAPAAPRPRKPAVHKDARSPTPPAGTTSKSPLPPAEPDEADSVRLEAEVGRLRALAERQPDSYRPQLARALMRLSDALAIHGRYEEALTAADEAVDIAEDLRDRFGEIYRTLTAWTSYTLGQRLRDAGRLDDATALYAEAVDIFRDTHRNDPYERAKTLGAAIIDYAGQLLRQDRYEEAVAAAQEAIGLIRVAVAEAPHEFTRLQTFALRNLSVGLRGLGRHDEALDAARRWANVARAYASKEPARGEQLLREAREHLAELLESRDQPDSERETFGPTPRPSI